MSSYQLEHVHSVAPQVAVFTRFSPHHLERHGSIERYLSLKHRIFSNQSANDFAVVLNESPTPATMLAQVKRFAACNEDVAQLNIPVHQRENLAGALAAARCIDPEIGLHGLDLDEVFELPHRVEFLNSLNGVAFYNDSKATTPEATMAALNSFSTQEIALVLGGSGKEANEDQLIDQVVTRDLRSVILMGDSSERLAEMFKLKGFTRFHICESHREIVERALEVQPEVCLFSPAAPSFDRFESYIDRGESFRKALASFSS